MSLFDDDLDDVNDALRGAASGINSGGNAVVSGLKSLATGLLGGALGNAVTAPLTLGLGALALGTGVLLAAFKSVTDEAMRSSSALASLRASQGLTFNQGFQLTAQNRLQGISSQQTAQMFSAPGMNPVIAGLRARALGGTSPYAPDAMLKNAQKYQSIAKSGFMGPQRANAWIGGIYGGQAPDSVLLAMNQRPDLIAGNLAYGRQYAKSMGVTGEMQRKYAEDIPMAVNRVGFAVDTAKIRLAVELAPVMERALTSFATLLANNAPRIAEGIQTVGKFLVQDFPPMLMRGAGWIAKGLGAMLTGIGTFSKYLSSNVRPILGTFDVILNGLRTFGGVVAGFGAALIQGAGMLYNGIANSKLFQLLKNVVSWTVGTGAKSAGTKTLGIPAWALPPAAAAAANWVKSKVAPGGTSAAGAPAGSSTTFGARIPVATPWWKRAFAAATAPVRNLWNWGTSQFSGGGAAPGTTITPATVAAMSAGGSPWAYNPQRTIGQTFNQGQSDFLSNFGISNLANNPKIVGTGEMMFGKAGDAALRGGQKLTAFGDSLDKMAGNYSSEIAQQLKTIAETSKSNADSSKQIERNTGNGAQSQADLLANFPNMMRQLIALTSAYIAQDAAMSLLVS